MRRPPVPEDARACFDVWTTPDGVAHDLFVARGEDAHVVADLLVQGVSETLTGKRQYRLDEPTWLAQFVLRGSHVGCGYGGLGADGDLLRHSLRQLAGHAALVLDGARTRGDLEVRLEELDVILRALDRWDVLSAVVSASADRDEALRRLGGEPFRFRSDQADQVLDLRVSYRLQDRRAELRAEVEQVQAALVALNTAAAEV
ncbi:MAG: hypothetical protein JWN67_1009 [Actinomycetia bacterium]|nr:hypothetical protein [Actinomycetes bacterium]